MRRSAICTIVAGGLGALFLGAVLAVGAATSGFGLGELARPREEAWDQEYRYTWDTAEEEVTGLDISWLYGPVELKVGGAGEIRITERSREELGEEDRLELSGSGGVLSIRWNGDLLPLDLLVPQSKSLTVEVPGELAGQLEELRCRGASGTISAQGLGARELELSSDGGDLLLGDLRARTARLHTVSGTIRLEGAQVEERLEADTASGGLELSAVSAGEAALSSVTGRVGYLGEADLFRAETISGRVEARLANCPGEARLSSVSGGVTLAIPENPGFDAAYSSVSGGFSCDFPVSGGLGSSGRALYGDGSARLELTTTSGQILVARG